MSRKHCFVAWLGGIRMRIIRFNENLLEQCVEFWWRIYEPKPYIVRPDGYQEVSIR